MTTLKNSLPQVAACLQIVRRGCIALLYLGFQGALPTESRAQGYAPEDAPRHMTLPAELEVQLVASEPMIVQPVGIEFDDRGRPWVLQYIQYPNPAELKRARVDRWSRTTYDRVPEPPPRGPKGGDRITILEDTNHDGRVDAARDFVSGLNLATGLAFGHGGVFVLNVPYLLFYPDRDRNDVPDGDPEVCVTGFGMDDAHSVANSLTWGPDGWLYGCQGSTVTARIEGQEFQQAVWRYHPLTRAFEVFMEGGGNDWGLDFDSEGELFVSTNVGGYRAWHAVQGGYYWKSFGKHGALHNPYAFGFLDHVAHTNFTGGHVTVGGILYQGTNLPPKFQGRYISGDPLGHGVQWHELYPFGSTFTSSHGGSLCAANDLWSVPTDIALSPDGAIYFTDWFDPRTAHPDPDAEWDRSNGRIYRISARKTQPSYGPDFQTLGTTQLIELLGNPNDYTARRARRVLADRRDPAAIAPLRDLLFNSPNRLLALQSLWALHVSGGLDETSAAKALGHPHAPIRKWTVRLLGDEKRALSKKLSGRLTELAATESDIRVRSQLAATAQRLPSDQALPVIEALLARDIDGADPHLPLQLWWAVERHSIQALPAVTRIFSAPTMWRSGLARDSILERLMRRWIAEGTSTSFDAAAQLLASAPNPIWKQRLLVALNLGFDDRPNGETSPGMGGLFEKEQIGKIAGTTTQPRLEPITPALAEQLDAVWKEDTTNTALIGIGIRMGQQRAIDRARTLLVTESANLLVRMSMTLKLTQTGDPSDAVRLLKLVGNAPELLQLAALDSLPAFDVPELAPELLKRYASLSSRGRSRVRQLLVSRKSWAKQILNEVDSGRLPAQEFSTEQVRVIALHKDPELDEIVRRHWGRLEPGTPEEKLAEMRRLNNDLNAGPGEATSGRAIFQRLCGVCHSLFGEGGGIGPELTAANRTDREFLLASIVNPSGAIRKEFASHEVEMRDGRILSGVILNQSGSELVLGIGTGEKVTLQKSQVSALRESPLSLMPEGLVNALKPKELRDLFSYLQSKKP
jgi:putative membrane-bound dehydrogenase-like protein